MSWETPKYYDTTTTGASQNTMALWFVPSVERARGSERAPRCAGTQYSTSISSPTRVRDLFRHYPSPAWRSWCGLADQRGSRWGARAPASSKKANAFRMAFLDEAAFGMKATGTVTALFGFQRRAEVEPEASAGTGSITREQEV